MAVMHRFVLLVALAASVIPYAAATSNSCPSNQFSWRSAKGDCCLPHGGSSGPSPPSGSSCPSKWYWSSQENCCVPSVPTEPTTPSCSGSSSWNSKEQCCKPSAPVTSSKPAAPVTTSKPAAPVTTSKPAAPATTSKPSSPTTTSPPSSPSSPTECSGGDFLWNALNGKCCVPHGGQPSPPSPPPGKSCPSSWYWHDQQSCCVPNHPSPPTPTCPSNSWWGNQCCNHGAPPPKPSGHYSYKRNQKKRSTNLCPLGLQACPVSGALGLTADYECIDTNVELQSCGGCSSLDPELDCTAIEGSWNVGCEKGSCKVYSCQAGYKLARDGTSCLKL